ncbi:MAG: ATP synthase F0 subunit B [Eubacteriales bacterium]|nr:ATP synthase F0 subunit B [Clostridiales bacterium]MDY5836580.1 ATP synthase F0 subunit B [Eubacteriales bacterium]
MPLNINWLQILLHLLNFLILFLVLYLAVYEPVVKFMQKRRDKYQAMEDQAAELKAKQASLEADYAQERDQIQAKLAEEKSQARKDLEEAKALAQQEAEDEAQKILAQARKDAQMDRDKLMHTAQHELRDLVVKSRKAMASRDMDSYEQFLATVGIAPSPEVASDGPDPAQKTEPAPASADPGQ